MTSEDWQATVAPKIHGSINLCNVLGKDADFFVSLSSIVALSGNVGQCNYAAACSFQDSLARHSTELGIRAYAINVGYVQETGYVSENPEIAATLRRQGVRPIRLSDVLVLLNYGINNAGRSDGVTRGCSLGLMPTDEAVNAGQVLWLKERRFNHLVRHEKAVQKTSSASVDALTLLAAATQQEEAVHIICQAILQRLARLIATSIQMLSPTKSLDSYGVDSLVAVELRNWVGSYLQANISLIALRGASSIQHLAQIVTKESALVSFEAAKNDVA